MKKSPVVYVIKGIIPYSCRDHSVIAVYLDEKKANKRYEDERNDDTYMDVQMEYYEVDD